MKRHKAPRVRWAPVIVGALVIAGGIAFWVSRHDDTPAVPVIDTKRLEPDARRTMQRHIDAIKAAPKSGLAWGQLGSTLRAFDFPAEARRCFVQAQRFDPRNPRWPYFESLLLTSENPGAAIEALRRTVDLCGNEPEMPRFRLAQLLAEQGRWPEAEVELRGLLAAKPGFSPATLLLAHRSSLERRLSEAIALASSCTNDARTARAAFSLLATLHRRNGDAARAESALQMVSTLRPDQSLGDPFETEAAVQRANPREIALQTHELLAAGRLAEAQTRIDQLINRHPEFAEGLLLLGRFQILSGDFAGAEKSLRQFMAREPRSTQGLFQLGTALLNQNRFVEAAELFEQATIIQPDLGPAHFNRGYALARAGKPKEAIPWFREAIRHNPEHVESYLLLADLHRQVAEKDQALKVLAEGLALKPNDSRLVQLRSYISSQMK